jgi:hypothetical protein
MHLPDLFIEGHTRDKLPGAFHALRVGEMRPLGWCAHRCADGKQTSDKEKAACDNVISHGGNHFRLILPYQGQTLRIKLMKY